MNMLAESERLAVWYDYAGGGFLQECGRYCVWLHAPGSFRIHRHVDCGSPGADGRICRRRHCRKWKIRIPWRAADWIRGPAM